METDVLGGAGGTIFLLKGPGPERQVPCKKGGRANVEVNMRDTYKRLNVN